jgi:hypothetical protein
MLLEIRPIVTHNLEELLPFTLRYYHALVQGRYIKEQIVLKLIIKKHLPICVQRVTLGEALVLLILLILLDLLGLGRVVGTILATARSIDILGVT